MLTDFLKKELYMSSFVIASYTAGLGYLKDRLLVP